MAFQWTSASAHYRFVGMKTYNAALCTFLGDGSVRYCVHWGSSDSDGVRSPGTGFARARWLGNQLLNLCFEHIAVRRVDMTLHFDLL
jgi:hypothetical protein